LVECIKRGNLTARGNDWDFEGHWRELIAGVNEVIDSFVSPFQVAAGNVHRIARGEIPGPITDRYHGDFNDIKKSVNLLIKELSSFIKEMSLLQDSHRIGEIDARMPEEQFQGVFRGMAEGVNHGMGMHISNQMKLLDVVTTYAKGDFSKTLQKLPGKQAVANDAVDLLRGNLQGVVRELATLTSAAVEGRLSVRADASQYQGDWKALIQGINGTLEAVVTPLQVAAESVDRISKGDIPPLITDEYRGDFNEIKININRCIQAIRALIEDSTRLSEGAIQGKLSTRIDANRHLGEFRAIMQGVNATLDAVIHPIDESRTVLEKLAGYDLRERVTSEFNGDHARIKDAVNATAEALHDAMAQVAAGAEQLSQAGARIAASSEQVATATADQARGLEKTAERLQKLQSMTQTNAEGTRTAKIVAQRAQEAADRGKVAMVEMAQAMEEIRVSSASTAQIIKDINEIAFQTNLLALNAAVEAARAGDAGQGFAVVASEVRNLAVRSKEAAKTTEKLIERAVKLADNGEYLSKGVAQNLSQITEAVNEVGKIVDEIATASQKQEKGMSIVGKTVTQLAEMTQSNADSAKESSEAAEELASQTDELSSLVARFELNSQQVQVSEEDSL
jgi:methyl-accepting chemotaxis protein